METQIVKKETRGLWSDFVENMAFITLLYEFTIKNSSPEQMFFILAEKKRN